MAIHVNTQNHTDKGIEPRPQTACMDRHAYALLFKQKTKYTHPHIHGINHGTLHNTGMPLILPIGTGAVRDEE